MIGITGYAAVLEQGHMYVIEIYKFTDLILI